MDMNNLNYCERQEIEWICQQVVEQDLGLWEPQSEDNDYYILLRSGRFAAAKPLLTKSIKDWEAGIELFKIEGRRYIERRLEDVFSSRYIRLPKFKRLAVAQGVCSQVRSDLHKQILRMKRHMEEVAKGLEQWGDEKPVEVIHEESQKEERERRLRLRKEKPVEVRYKEIWKRLWMFRIRLWGIAGIFNFASAMFLWGFSFSMWWILIPVMVSLVLILWIMAVQFSEYGDFYILSCDDDDYGESELRDFIKTKGKTTGRLF